MRQKFWKLPNFKIKPFLRKLKDDPRCQSEGVVSALELNGVMLNMDQESGDNDGNKSDMRPASKFRGRGIKFHHLQPHIFLPYPLMPCETFASSYTWFYSVTNWPQVYCVVQQLEAGRGWDRFDFIPKWTETNIICILILQWGRRGLENKYYLTRYNGKLKFNVTLGTWSTVQICEITQKY